MVKQRTVVFWKKEREGERKREREGERRRKETREKGGNKHKITKKGSFRLFAFFFWFFGFSVFSLLHLDET